MKEWCLEHPYMAFTGYMWTVTTFMYVMGQLAEAFKKPQPTTINLKVPESFPGLDRDDLN